MTTPALLCAAAEIALNRYLRLEPGVLEDCARLSGRCIAIQLPATGWTLAIEFMSGGVRVMPAPPGAVEVSIQGTPSAMIAALREVAGESSALPSGLKVEGDAELLAQFRSMVTRVGFDPEEWLAPLLGGATAHRVVGSLKKMFDWSRGNARRVADNGAEYLREETYDLARGRDVETWMDDVDDTRETLDRLEARLRRLEAGASTSASIPTPD